MVFFYKLHYGSYKSEDKIRIISVPFHWDKESAQVLEIIGDHGWRFVGPWVRARNDR